MRATPCATRCMLCMLQVTMLKQAEGPVLASDIPHNIRITTTTQSPLSRQARACPLCHVSRVSSRAEN
jgi:hypothetical protein